MPHKRNPVISENLTGLARLVRGYALPALEDVALWHERDISHSSVERVIGPDATIALDFALVRLTELIKKPRGLPAADARQSRPARRPRPLAARAARFDRGRRVAGGRLHGSCSATP